MKWLEPSIIPISDDLLTRFSDSHFLAEQLALRNIHSERQAEQFLYTAKYIQQSPFCFVDMHKIVGRIRQAIHNKQKIGVWGDFDVDGQTSTTLLVDGLRKIGADVDFYIPVRATESHGIQTVRLKKFFTKGVQLLITCDTGITEFAALEYARSAGVDVIISDHHTPEAEIPHCFAVLNPWLLPEENSLRGLAGVGVAFQILRAWFETYGELNLIDDYCDLVALGTVADVAELCGENRFYTQTGLALMQKNLRPSIAAILDAARISHTPITESLISFTLAPRLNAVGRLANANKMVNFLLKRDQQFLEKTALQLEELNNERKEMVEAVFSACLHMIEKKRELLQYPVLVLAGKGWIKGVIGIVASRLVEQFHKPAILISTNEKNSSGSARSVEGINIIEAIRDNHNLLNGYGGHPMAAGFALPTENIAAFREALSASVYKLFPDLIPEKKLQIDAYFDFSRLNSELVTQISLLSPFGRGNNPPVLVSRNLEIDSAVQFGKNDSHLKVVLKNPEGESRQAIWWNASRSASPQGSFDLAYFLRADSHDPAGSFILEWIDFRESLVEEIKLASRPSPIQIFDHRSLSENLKTLSKEMSQQEVVYWGEGIIEKQGYSLKNRLELECAEILVILSPPPNPAVLSGAIKTVKPKIIYLSSIINPDDTFKGFIHHLAGLIKFILREKSGTAKLNEMAAFLGHTETTILIGLHWWQAHGDVNFDYDGAVVQITNASGAISSDLNQITHTLKKSLSESAAFRSYYLRADAYHLIFSHFLIKSK